MPNRTHLAVAIALLLLAPGARAEESVALDNPYVHVTRGGAPCAAAATPGCGDRIVVAMGDLELRAGGKTKKLKRGGVAIFPAGKSYEPPSSGDYFEVAIKPDHPPVKSPPENIPPAKNAMLWQGPKFFVYQERLAVGDTRPRHTHSQRVEIRINQGPMLEQVLEVDGAPKKIAAPAIVNFREASIHSTHNVGDMPLFNIIVEFRPQGAP